MRRASSAHAPVTLGPKQWTEPIGLLKVWTKVTLSLVLHILSRQQRLATFATMKGLTWTESFNRNHKMWNFWIEHCFMLLNLQLTGIKGPYPEPVSPCAWAAKEQVGPLWLTVNRSSGSVPVPPQRQPLHSVDSPDAFMSMMVEVGFSFLCILWSVLTFFRHSNYLNQPQPPSDMPCLWLVVRWLCSSLGSCVQAAGFRMASLLVTKTSLLRGSDPFISMILGTNN